MDRTRNSKRSAARLAIADVRQSDETDEWRRRMSPEMYTTLKAIQRNDAAVTELCTTSHYTYTDRNEDSCLPLGPALASNSHVTTLSMSLSHFYPTNSHEQVWCTQLRQWIRESRSIRNIAMLYDNSDYEFSCSIFDDISRNPHLQVLRVAGVVSFDSVLRLLQSQTLRTLHFGACTFEGIRLPDPNNDLHRRALAEALGANSMLEELILHRDQYDLGFIVFEAILGTLSQNPRLRTLELIATTYDVDEPGPTFMVALLSFLAAAPSLCHFSITFAFDNEAINQLLDGFRRCRTLEKATFHGCTFDSEAVESLVSYSRSTTAVPAIGIRDVQYNPDGVDSTWFMLAAVFPILSRSSLQVLELSNVLLWRQVDTSHAQASHLANTRLHRLLVRLDAGHEAVQMIANALPTIRHLRVLEIEIVLGVGGNVDSQSFIQGLRQNGSLHHFALRSCDDRRPFPEYSAESALNAHDTELVRSICLRNQNLAALLRRPKLTVDPTPDTKTDVESFPDLFVAASEPTIAGPNTVLVGLLALNDSLQRRDLPGKRKAANPT